MGKVSLFFSLVLLSANLWREPERSCTYYLPFATTTYGGVTENVLKAQSNITSLVASSKEELLATFADQNECDAKLFRPNALRLMIETGSDVIFVDECFRFRRGTKTFYLSAKRRQDLISYLFRTIPSPDSPLLADRYPHPGQPLRPQKYTKESEPGNRPGTQQIDGLESER